MSSNARVERHKDEHHKPLSLCSQGGLFLCARCAAIGTPNDEDEGKAEKVIRSPVNRLVEDLREGRRSHCAATAAECGRLL
jgi:hypothetical protein